MKPGERNLMVIFLVMASAAALLSLWFQLPEARMFPLITGSFTALLIVAYFVVMHRPSLRAKLGPYLEDDIFMKISAAADAIGTDEAEEASKVSHKGLGGDDRQKRELQLFLYLAGLGILSALVGLTIAVPIFLLAVIVRYASESWKRGIIVTVVTSAFIYFVFFEVLNLPLHFGLLERLM